MTQMYWLDRILYKNRIADSIRPAPGLGIMRFVGSVMKERQEQLASGKAPDFAKEQTHEDFLSHFLRIQETQKELPPW